MLALSKRRLYASLGTRFNVAGPTASAAGQNLVERQVPWPPRDRRNAVFAFFLFAFDKLLKLGIVLNLIEGVVPLGQGFPASVFRNCLSQGL